MNDLLEIHNGEPFASSIKIADGVEYTHHSVITLIRKKLEVLKIFGRVEFEIRPFETKGGKQNREVALLNEPQTSLLLTFMRDNEIITKFKVKLIGAFYQMREMLAAPSPVGDLKAPAEMDILLEKMVLVREARRTKGKAAASHMWDWLGLPNVAPEKDAVTNGRNLHDKYTDTEAYGVLQGLIELAPYPALQHKQVLHYVRANCTGRVDAALIAAVVRQARIPSRGIKLRGQVFKVKLFGDRWLTSAEVQQAVDVFNSDYR